MEAQFISAAAFPKAYCTQFPQLLPEYIYNLIQAQRESEESVWLSFQALSI